MPTYYALTRNSNNPKTGNMQTVVISRDSCPPSCPLIRDECYGEGGPIAWHWNKVSNGDRGTADYDQFCREVAAIPRHQVWRYGVVGELPRGVTREHISGPAMDKLVAANRGRRGFCYTHKQPTVGNNREIIERANAKGFTVNLSADDLDEADKFIDSGIKAPVVVVVPSTWSDRRAFTTPKGRKGTICPNSYNKDIKCDACQICVHAGRKGLIGFPAHGRKKKKIDRKMKNYED